MLLGPPQVSLTVGHNHVNEYLENVPLGQRVMDWHLLWLRIGIFNFNRDVVIVESKDFTFTAIIFISEVVVNFNQTIW